MFENVWLPGLGAVTNLKLLEKQSKQLHQLFDYNHLLFTMQTRKGEREVGVVIEADQAPRTSGYYARHAWCGLQRY